MKFFHKVPGLKVNIEKTKVVQLGVAGDGRMINIEKEKLELTNELVLLGIQFNSKRLSKITEDKLQIKIPKDEKNLKAVEKKKINDKWKDICL